MSGKVRQKKKDIKRDYFGALKGIGSFTEKDELKRQFDQ